MRALVPAPVAQPGAAPAEEPQGLHTPNCNRCQKRCAQRVHCCCRVTVYCSTACRDRARHDCAVVDGIRAVDELRPDRRRIASAAATMAQMANNHVLLLPSDPLQRLRALAEELNKVLKGAELSQEWAMAAVGAHLQGKMTSKKCEQAMDAAFSSVDLIHEWLREFELSSAALRTLDDTSQERALLYLSAIQHPECAAQLQNDPIARAPTRVRCELHENGIKTMVAQQIFSRTVAMRQSAITAKIVLTQEGSAGSMEAYVERLESAETVLFGLTRTEHIRCENGVPRVLTITLPPALGGGTLNPPVFQALDLYNLFFCQYVLAIQIYPRGGEDSSPNHWSDFADLMRRPIREQQGSLLHTLEVLVQRYGDEFRRQIAQPGTHLTWVRLNAPFWREAVRLAVLNAGVTRIQSIIIDAATILPLAGKHREMGLIFLNWAMYCWRIRSQAATVAPLWASCAVMRDGEPGAPASAWTPLQEVDFVLDRTAVYLAAAGRSHGCRVLHSAVLELRRDPSRLERDMPAPGEGPDAD
jgi:hypothetical protein